MPKKGSKRVKTKTHKKQEVQGATILEGGVQKALEADLPPRSIVARSSKVVAQVGELVQDFRKLMGPHTASNLKEQRKNRMKDYTQVATQLGVSHIITISQTKSSIVMRVGRTPTGPTLHFRVAEYSLARAVRSLQKRPQENPSLYLTPPLVVLNNFGSSEEQHVKLMKVTFQHMFPSINVKTVKLAECRRVVLFQLRKEDGLVEMRHYSITANPVGINKNLKKIISGRLPNLSELKDVSEFLTGNAGAVYPVSDSEAEDETTHVQLAQKYIGRGNNSSQKSAMKLVELGPRMTLELFKVERGVCEGDVLYHKDIKKSEAEAKQIKQKLDAATALKIERKAIQAANVERKKAELEEKKANKKRRINPYSVGGKAAGSGSDEEEGQAHAGRGSGDEDEEEEDEEEEGEYESDSADDSNRKRSRRAAGAAADDEDEEAASGSGSGSDVEEGDLDSEEEDEDEEE